MQAWQRAATPSPYVRSTPPGTPIQRRRQGPSRSPRHHGGGRRHRVLAQEPFNGAATTACQHAGVSDRILALDPTWSLLWVTSSTRHRRRRAVRRAGQIQRHLGALQVDHAAGRWATTSTRETPSAIPRTATTATSGPRPETREGFYYAYDIGDWRAIVLNTGALDYTRPAAWTAPCPTTATPCRALRQPPGHLATQRAGRPAARQMRRGLLAPPPVQLARALQLPELTPIYDALYDGGAELALAGHDHSYERFAPMTGRQHRGPELRGEPVHGRHRRQGPPLRDPGPLRHGQRVPRPQLPGRSTALWNWSSSLTLRGPLVRDDGAVRDRTAAPATAARRRRPSACPPGRAPSCPRSRRCPGGAESHPSWRARAPRPLRRGAATAAPRPPPACPSRSRGRSPSPPARASRAHSRGSDAPLS